MTTEERLTRLESMLGASHLGKASDQLAASLIPENELPGGRYPYILSDYQIRIAFADALAQIESLKAKVQALEARPTGTVTPSPTTGLPLVPDNGAVAVREMRNLTNASRIYSHGQFDVPDANVVNQPTQFMREVGIGGPPMQGHPLAVRKGGEVVFSSRVLSANTQEKSGDKTRLGVFSFNEYDNGVRMIQNAVWHDGVCHRVADNVRILGMDSAGTVSYSDEDMSKPEAERGQLWIMQVDHEKKVLRPTVCRAGWGVELGASTQTMNDHNKNPQDRSAAIIAPLSQSRDIQAP